MQLVATGLIALGLTLYVIAMPGTQYILDGAAVVAWIAFSREVALATP